MRERKRAIEGHGQGRENVFWESPKSWVERPEKPLLVSGPEVPTPVKWFVACNEFITLLS